MLKKMKKFEKNRTKPGNQYYLVLFENRTKPGTVLSRDSLYVTTINEYPDVWNIMNALFFPQIPKSFSLITETN